MREGSAGKALRAIPGLHSIARWFDDTVILPAELRRAGWHFGPHCAAIGKRKCIDMLRGTFERETLEVFRQVVPRGSVAIDIGANFGYFTRHLSTLVGAEGRVIAFEAHPEVFAYLQKNVAGRGNIVLHNAAVADKRGLLELYSMDNPLAHSLFPTGDHLGTWAVRERIAVEAVSLDELLHELDVTARPLVVKMDIEGAEPMALRGMERLIKRSPDVALVVEYSPACLQLAGSSGPALLAQLWALGFSIRPIEHSAAELASPPDRGWHVNLLCLRGAFADNPPPGLRNALSRPGELPV